MKKYLFTLLMFHFIVLNTNAQNLMFHTGGGLNSLIGHESNSIGAFKIGASIELELSQRLVFEPGLLFFSKGWKEKDKVIPLVDDFGNPIKDQNNNPRTTKMGIKCGTSYIVMPLLVNYYIPIEIPRYIVLTAGPYVAYGIGGKTRVSGDVTQKGVDKIYNDRSTFSIEGMRRWDAGITMGVGYEFNRIINAGIEANMGLLKVSPDTGRNFSLMLTLGYRIPLDD